jgi:hypothetical protein
VESVLLARFFPPGTPPGKPSRLSRSAAGLPKAHLLMPTP